MFKPILIATCLGLSFAACAADEKNARSPNSQDTRTAACNKEAGEKKLQGDRRTKFMTDCMSSGSALRPDKTTACNKTDRKKAPKDEKHKGDIAIDSYSWSDKC